MAKRFPALALVLLFMPAACSGYATHFAITPDSQSVLDPEMPSLVLKAVESFALEHDLRREVTLASEDPAITGSGHLGRFVGVATTGHEAWEASLHVSVGREASGTAVYVYFLDLANSSETDYARALRTDLERRLGLLADEHDVSVSVIYRGKAGAPFIAP